MPLLGKGKDKKGKKGLLGSLGIKAEKAPSQTAAEDQRRHEAIKKAWGFLRRQIDSGVEEYFRSGYTDRLRDYVARPASDLLFSELEKLRSSGIYWTQPDRPTATQPKVEVIRERLNEHRQPVEFTVQERFKDHSVYRSMSGGVERVCEGKERVIQATVEVQDGQHYKLLSIIEVRGATL